MSDQVKDLCIALMKADAEEEVIKLLTEAGYWDDPYVWRYYGDTENNFSTINNQMENPDAAFVEKIVNSIDARLINECRLCGIDPEGDLAPQSIREAVAIFFDGKTRPISDDAGHIKNWSTSRRTEAARGITVAVTDNALNGQQKRGNPCLTIADCGEGQTPDNIPLTFLSLPFNRKNKQKIPFVQGKFNMGGTGALMFCGNHRLQFIVSRRNPNLLSSDTQPSDLQWGFTVVRREEPKDSGKSSVFTFLAPLGADGSHYSGGVLRFSSGSMHLFPNGQDPYAREAAWGSLIKLYEYSLGNYAGNILRRDGLLRRLDILLPDIALPIRLHECRRHFKGNEEGSFETTCSGLTVRLDDDQKSSWRNNIEESYPSCQLTVKGEEISIKIYVFKINKADTYKRDEGVVFVVNGQTHSRIKKDFFRRNSVVLSSIAESILVIADCSKMSRKSNEDIFKNSRDRMSNCELTRAIEEELEDLLKNHPGLRSLKEKRQREEIQSQLDNLKPIEDIIKSLVQSDPTLSKLFLPGNHISNPLKAMKAGVGDKPFKGKHYPTYFKFRNEEYGKELVRDCHINMRCRVSFDTDAEDNYFGRDKDPGRLSVYISKDGVLSPALNSKYSLHNGSLSLTLLLPDSAKVGGSITFVVKVMDNSRIEPFENVLTLKIKDELNTQSGHGDTHKPPDKKKGQDRDVPSMAAIPKLIPIGEEGWGTLDPPFDKYSALRISNDLKGDGQIEYTFRVNIDNVYLKAEMKRDPKSSKLLRNRFATSLYFLGLAVLSNDQQQEKGNNKDTANGGAEEDEISILNKIEIFSKAVAPVLLPVIDRLGSLKSEEEYDFQTLFEAV